MLFWVEILLLSTSVPGMFATTRSEVTAAVVSEPSPGGNTAMKVGNLNGVECWNGDVMLLPPIPAEPPAECFAFESTDPEVLNPPGYLASYYGDGYCDLSMNTPACNYDGGDCCSSSCGLNGGQLCGLPNNFATCIDPNAVENWKANGGDGASCQVCSCGQSSGPCSCDPSCVEKGDCCEDFWTSVCASMEFASSPMSCEGFCGYAKMDPGGQEMTCWCDWLCSSMGDCCEDFEDVCGSLPFLPTYSRLESCANFCGFKNNPGNCWCDEQCTYFQDCCSDAWKVCSVPGTCVGNCELTYDMGSNCNCDDNCEILLDCCDDVEEACRMAPLPTPIPVPAPVCSSTVFGDYNGDMVLDIIDIVQAINLITDDSPGDYCGRMNVDIDSNGTVNVIDVVGMINCIVGPTDACY